MELHHSRLPRELRTILRKRVDTNYFPRDCFVPRDFIGYLDRYIFLDTIAAVCATAPLFRHAHTSRFACDGWRYAPDNERIAAGVAIREH